MNYNSPIDSNPIDNNPLYNENIHKNNYTISDMPSPESTVAVGMSGGIDSSVTAYLLKSQGYNVVGVTMKIWGGESSLHHPRKTGCYGAGEIHDIEDARRMAQLIGIPFYVINLVDQYQQWVLNYFKEEYLRGRTPNPCVICNHRIKFGFLLDKLEKSGISADYFATGHYVRKFFSSEYNRFCIQKGLDPKKDQSYFLTFLSQEQIRGTLFPLGGFTKDHVRRLAEEFSLPVVQKPESQDFIDGGDYSVLFDEKPQPGNIIDLNGKILGQHRGIIHYTIGQRKGLGISHSEPLYVVDIDHKRNALIVGSEKDLYCDTLIADNVRWMLYPEVVSPVRLKTKIRLTARDADATVYPLDKDKVRVVFDSPQRFITPGQFVVFYHNDLLAGGGIITGDRQSQEEG